MLKWYNVRIRTKFWSNILLRLQEFPRASPSGTLSGGGVYLIVYLSSRPNTNTICVWHFNKSNPAKIWKSSTHTSVPHCSCLLLSVVTKLMLHLESKKIPFSEKPPINMLMQTVGARDLKFNHNIHHPLCGILNLQAKEFANKVAVLTLYNVGVLCSDINLG